MRYTLFLLTVVILTAGCQQQTSSVTPPAQALSGTLTSAPSAGGTANGEGYVGTEIDRVLHEHVVGYTCKPKETPISSHVSQIEFRDSKAYLSGDACDPNERGMSKAEVASISEIFSFSPAYFVFQGKIYEDPELVPQPRPADSQIKYLCRNPEATLTKGFRLAARVSPLGWTVRIDYNVTGLPTGQREIGPFAVQKTGDHTLVSAPFRFDVAPTTGKGRIDLIVDNARQTHELVCVLAP